MLGLIVILALSWILLYLTARRHIRVLGFLPFGKRLKQLFLGFVITAILCIAVQFAESFLNGAEWALNENFSGRLLLNALWWDLRSVLTEELIFRGAILYILIRKFGVNKAILLSATAFGVYHWFSFGIFGNILPMIVVFLGTGLMGLAWALAFSKTGSVLMPTGLHLGWNFTFNAIFSKGLPGAGVLISQGGQPMGDWFSLVGLLLVPILVLLFVKYFVADESNEFNQQKINTPVAAVAKP